MVELAKEIPKTKLITVCDREADFFEMFDEQRKNPGIDMLIRAHHNRNIKKDPFKLFDAVRQAPELSSISVSIPSQSARPKKSKQKKRAARPGHQILWHGYAKLQSMSAGFALSEYWQRL